MHKSHEHGTRDFKKNQILGCFFFLNIFSAYGEYLDGFSTLRAYIILHQA